MKYLRPLLLFFFVSVVSSHGTDRPLWLACGPAELLTPLKPLGEWRQQGGMEVLIVPGQPEAALRQAPRTPDFLLIVGDDDPTAADATWRVAAPRLPMSRWSPKQKTDYPSDFALTELDARGLPRFAVGRLPVRTAEECTTVVNKILAWEKLPATRASLSMPMWAGDPAYDPKFTEMFMGFLFAQLRKNSPIWMEPWLVSGDQRHPLCGWPTEQSKLFDQRTGEGALFAGMMGHGGKALFYSTKLERSWYVYHAVNATGLKEGPVRPPQLIFACECGVFDLPKNERCLAEALLLAPSGPVLTVAATNESHPLPNFYTGTNFLRVLKDSDGPVAFGTLWLRAQQEMRKRTDLVVETLLKGVEGNYGAAMDPQALKQNQASLYTIFGDPATALQAPRRLEVKIERTASGWTWQVTPPNGANGARLIVERRNPDPIFAERPVGVTQEDSRALFSAANKAIAFQPVAAEGWSGQTSEPGVLRFLVENSTGLWAAGVELP